MPLWNELMAVSAAAPPVWVGWKTLRFCPPGPEGPMVDSVEALTEDEREALRNLGYIQ